MKRFGKCFKSEETDPRNQAAIASIPHCRSHYHTIENMDASILAIQNVSKAYGKLQALTDTSFQIKPGEIFALLGPNGAGKTTLINCITGLILRFSGEIRVAGYDVRKQARITRQLIGLVPQELNFDPFFTVEQVLYYQSGFYNVPPQNEKIEKILSDFGLLEKRKSNTRALSGGMKRRLMICKALMHDPVLLFLDEPTAGVDVELRNELWKYVLKLKERGVTIFLTTHYLEEAEQLADRIAFINRGKILLVEKREDLLNHFGRRWNRITLRDPISENLRNALLQKGVSFENDRVVLINKNSIAESAGVTLDLHPILQEIMISGNHIELIDGGRNSLESIFREILQGASAESSHSRS